MNGSDADPRALVAVLGASNVTLALPQILDALHRRLAPSGPVEYYVAHGPGRSYGTIAGVPGIEFTPLRSCGLREALEARWRSAGRPPVSVLLTDVGNDVMYGASARGIAAWVREIVESFRSLGARTAITSVPVESVLSISAWKFGLIRPILYPRYPMRRRDVFTRVVQVQDALEELGRDLAADILPARREWYSIDCIHVARRWRRRVFGTWADALLERAEGSASGSERSAARLSISSARLRLVRPAEMYLFGRRLTRAQEGVRIADGARLYVY
jgi:hypothetical protein